MTEKVTILHTGKRGGKKKGEVKKSKVTTSQGTLRKGNPGRYGFLGGTRPTPTAPVLQEIWVERSRWATGAKKSEKGGK